MMDQLSENRISSDENSDRQLLRLAAASAVYVRGKKILGLQATLTVLGGFAFPIAVATVPQLKVWAVLYAFTVALLDALVLEQLQSKQRQTGARIQELFDCDLFQLPWRRLVAGEPPPPELVTEAASGYKRTHEDLSHLRDWYSPAVSRLSLPLARLVCQRTNAWWDSALRKRYCASLKVLLWALAIFVFVLAVYRGMTMDVFVLSFIAPLTPAILWGAREARKHSSAADDLEKLLAHIDRTWQKALSGTLSGDALLGKSISIQNQLFYFRSKNPFVFNWVYRLLRGKQEKTMHQVAEQFVDQALRQGR
jgi:hypothetical protein